MSHFPPVLATNGAREKENGSGEGFFSGEKLLGFGNRRGPHDLKKEDSLDPSSTSLSFSEL